MAMSWMRKRSSNSTKDDGMFDEDKEKKNLRMAMVESADEEVKVIKQMIAERHETGRQKLHLQMMRLEMYGLQRNGDRNWADLLLAHEEKKLER